MRLQSFARGRQVRHTCSGDWNELRRLLASRLRNAEWEVLHANMWIRREWYQEPKSWIYMLSHEEYRLKDIVEECMQASVHV